MPPDDIPQTGSEIGLVPPIVPSRALGAIRLSETAAAGVTGFIERWQASGANERANYVMFLTERRARLDLPQPEPARDDG